MANLSASGLSSFRRWYTQYKAIHGTEPPQDLMNSYLAGEMEADLAREQQSRQISLQEKSINNTADYQNKSLAQQAGQFATNVKLAKNAQDAQEQANMISGVKDIASLGIEGYKALYPSGSTTAPATTTTRQINIAPETTSSSFANAPEKGYGGGDGGYGLGESVGRSGDYGYGVASGADLESVASNTGYGLNTTAGGYAGEGASQGLGKVSLSSGSEAGLGSNINWEGLGGGVRTGLTSAAIEYTKPAVVDYLGGENKDAGKAADVSSQIGQGALWGSRFGGVGSAIGAVIGAEKGGAEMKGADFKTTSGWKEYNKEGGIAALFGITSGQVESDKDSSSVKTAKAILTGGASKFAAKLKKLF